MRLVSGEPISWRARFEQKWLHLELPLRDGSRVTVDVTLRVRERKITKKSSLRQKIKLRQMERVRLRISAPRGRSFATGRRLASAEGRRIAGLELRRVSVQPRASVFVWDTGVLRGVHGRYGWNQSGEYPLTSTRLLGVILGSYKLLASERAP